MPLSEFRDSVFTCLPEDMASQSVEDEPYTFRQRLSKKENHRLEPNETIDPNEATSLVLKENKLPSVEEAFRQLDGGAQSAQDLVALSTETLLQTCDGELEGSL